jgi:hypothetical protein
MAFGFHRAQDRRTLGGLRPVFIWRVIFDGQVVETVDPAEVALITHRYPQAVVQVVPCS